MELLIAFVAGLLVGIVLMWLVRGAFTDTFRALSAEALQRNNQAFLDLAQLALGK